jgi:hypothetical protein
MRKKIKSFKDAVRFLNSIPDINCGGCGIAAVSLYLWLKKNGYNVKNTKVVYLYSDSDSYRTNQSFLSNEDVYATSCEHAVLYHKGRYIDSRGVIDDNTHTHPRVSRYNMSHFIDFDVKFFRASFSSDYWNDYFERQKEVPRIEKVLGIDLRDVVNI